MSREATLRELALEVAWKNWGRPYTWGGDDPSSFDCSGLMLEILKSVGLFPRKRDTTADGILSTYDGCQVSEEKAQAGDLVFFLNGDDRAVHVEMVVEDDGELLFSIGASGGGPACRTVEIAWQRNAYTKIRPVNTVHPSLNRVYVNPYQLVREE